MLDITKGSWWVHEDWPKVKEKEYSLSIKVTDTQKRTGLKNCHNRQSCQIVWLQRIQLQGDIHWCKTDFKNYWYLEKGM